MYSYLGLMLQNQELVFFSSSNSTVSIGYGCNSLGMASVILSTASGSCGCKIFGILYTVLLGAQREFCKV